MLFENKFALDAVNDTHDDLLFVPAILEAPDFNDGWQVAVKPILDAWWNAYGLDRCAECFDNAGNWTGYNW